MELKTGLQINQWWHAITAFGATAALAALAAPIDKLIQGPIFLCALGLFFVGIGEWMNHPFQTYLAPPNEFMPSGGTLTGHPRRPSPLGIAVDAVGLLLLGVGLVKLMWRA